MKELIEKVVQWGKDRGLNKVGHLAQAKYTLKETAELLDAYADQDIAKINDAIGDIAVTLIVGASNDKDIIELFSDLIANHNHAYLFINDNFFDNYEKVLFRCGMLFRYQDLHNYTECYLALKYLLASINIEFKQQLTIKDCLQLAYDEIKNRKGKLVNGQFIKE